MHRIGYALPEGFQVMALGTQTVFELANLMMAEPFYAVDTYALDGSARASTGLTLQARPLTARSQADTWLVAGTLQPLAAPAAPELLRLLDGSPRAPARRRPVHGRLRAGRRRPARRTPRHHALVLGRRLAATPPPGAGRGRPHLHRRRAGLDIRRHDRRDRPGAGAGGKDLGTKVARAVAHRLVMHQRRSGGQSQHSEMLRLAPKSDRIQLALEHARRNLAQPLSVEELAQAAKLSPRQFSRVFTAETGQSPAKAVERLRLEAARLMIEGSRHPLEVVARETGFRDRRHMREAFLRGFGMPPQAVRREARTMP